ncbi:MAG: AraC family transcriptional regulator [Crocinitomicaceae bacterium]|nr:AraC family transcriptional regulator [Crocinitomicaceae bacterium]
MKAPQNSTQADYIKRINKVFEYIEQHLNENLSLDQIARIAHFSPFHFHRIFKTLVGQTLNDYISRQRLNRAANYLLHNPDVNIGALAIELGFSSNAVFTRAFKRVFGQSPSSYNQKNYSFSKMSKTKSKAGKTTPDYPEYVRSIDNLKKWINMNGKVEVKQVEKMEMAYITCFGVDELGPAFERLMQWGNPKGFFDGDNPRMVTVYHDSFKTTDADKVRMSVGLITDKAIQPEGEVGNSQIEGGKTIVSRFEIGQDEFEKAWSSAFIWMNENGYSISDQNPYEIYYNDYREHPERKFILDICIPVN